VRQPAGNYAAVTLKKASPPGEMRPRFVSREKKRDPYKQDINSLQIKVMQCALSFNVAGAFSYTQGTMCKVHGSKNQSIIKLLYALQTNSQKA
jgi:hypothetical protein